MPRLVVEFLLISVIVFEASALYHFAKFGGFAYPRFYALTALVLTAVFVGRRRWRAIIR